MTREQLNATWRNARYIFLQSRLPDVRRAAKEIAVMVESQIGQVEGMPADTWEV